MIYESACSGIEAASAAWGPLGWTARYFAEIDRFASDVLRFHYPEVPNAGDFTLIGADDYEPSVVLVAGTPCQDFSVAGLRAGVDGDRGNLTLEFLRLVGRRRPKWVVWENVPGVLSSTSHRAPDPCPPPLPVDLELDGQEVDVEDEYGGEELHALNCFVAGFSELGYGWAMGVLDAQHFGVPQRRRRVFVVGHIGDDWRSPAAVLFERHSLSGDTPPRREAREEVAPTIPSRSLGGGGFGTDFDCDGGLVESAVAGPLGAGDGSRGWRNDLDQGAFIPVGQDWPAEVAPTLGAEFGEKQGLDDQHIGGGQVCSSVTAKWAKGSGGPSGDECQNLIATEASSMMRRRGGFFEHPAEVAHSLRGEGFDASEDGPGRGTPLVPVVANTLKANRGDGGGGIGPDETFVPVAFNQTGAGWWNDAENAATVRKGDDAGGGGARESTLVGVPVAFDCKASGRNGFGVGETAPTLRAMGHANSHQNAGGQVAVAFRACGQDGFTPAPVAPPISATDGGGSGVPTVAIQNATRGKEQNGLGISDDGTMYTLDQGSQHAGAFAQNTRDEVRLVGGDGGITGALAAEPGMKQQTYVAGAMAVRRLTPRE